MHGSVSLQSSISGHPNDLVLLICNLLLERVVISDGNSKLVDGRTWMTESKGKSLKDTAMVYVNRRIIKSLLSENIFDDNPSSNNESFDEAWNVSAGIPPSQSLFLLLLHSLSLVSRWTHNRMIIAQTFGENFSKIIAHMYLSLTSKIEELVVLLSDVRDRHEQASDALLKETLFALSSLFALSQFMSFGALSHDVSVKSKLVDLIFSQPTDFRTIFSEDMIDLFPSLSESSIKDVFKSVEFPKSDDISNRYHSTESNYSSSSINELVHAGAIRVSVSLLRKLSHLSRALLTQHQFRVDGSIRIRKLWRLSILLQCECLTGVLLFLATSSLAQKKYSQCDGPNAVQSLLSLKDVSGLIDCDDYEKEIVFQRAILCLKVNMNSGSIMDDYLLVLDSLDPFFGWMCSLNKMKYAHRDVIISSDEISASCSALLSPSLLVSNNMRYDYMLTKSLHPYASQNSFRPVLFDWFDCLTYDFSFFQSNQYFPTWLCKNRFSGMCRYFFKALFESLHSKPEWFEKSLCNVITRFINVFHSEIEVACLPVVQFHFVFFISACYQRNPSVVLTFKKTKLWKFLVTSPLFLQSGIRNVNRLSAFTANVKVECTSIGETYSCSIGFPNDSVEITDCFSCQYKLLHDLILNFFVFMGSESFHTSRKTLSDLSEESEDFSISDNFDDEIDHLLCSLTVHSVDDIVVQICRCINKLVLFAENCKVSSRMWCNVATKISSLCKHQTLTMTSLDFVGDLSKRNFKGKYFLWPSRVAVVESLYTLMKSKISIGWLKAFLSRVASESDSGIKSKGSFTDQSPVMVHRLSISSSNKMEFTSPNGKTLSRGNSLNSSSMSHSSHITQMPSSGATRATKYSAFFQLLTFPRFRNIVLEFIFDIFSESSLFLLYCHNKSYVSSSRSSLRRMTVLNDFVDLKAIEDLNKDIVRHVLLFIRSTSRQPEFSEAHIALSSILKYLFASISASDLISAEACRIRLEKYSSVNSMFFRELFLSVGESSKKSNWSGEVRKDILCSLLSIMLNVSCMSPDGQLLVQNLLLQKHKFDKNIQNSFAGYFFDEVISVILSLQSNPAEDIVILVLSLLFDKSLPKISFEMGEDGVFADPNIAPPIIANTSVIAIIIGLLPHLDKMQKGVLNSLRNLIIGEGSMVNLSKCVQLQPSVLELVLDVFPRLSVKLHPIAVELVQRIGRYTITVSQMKRIFKILQTKGEKRPRFTPLILQALQGMINTADVPRNFILFQGNGSGLLLPPINKWPASRGYSFSTWFCVGSRYKSPFNQTDSLSLDDSRNSSASTGTENSYRPTLLSFCQNNGIGIEVCIVSGLRINENKIVIRIFPNLKTQKPVKFEIDFDLYLDDVGTGSQGPMNERNIWHHLAFSHVPSSFQSKSEIFVLVDGKEYSSQLSYPRFNDVIEYPLIGECLATVRDPNGLKTSFCGQIAALYFFSDALKFSQLRLIYSLGPSYCQVFNDKEGLSSAGDSSVSKSLNGSLTSLLMLAFSPGVWKGRCFVDITPEINSNRLKIASQSKQSSENKLTHFSNIQSNLLEARFIQAHRLPGTYRCTYRDMRNSLDCLGGIKVLLPLFAQLDLPPEEIYDDIEALASENALELPDDSSSTCSQLLELIFSLLRNSAVNNKFVAEGGFALIAYFLDRISPKNLSLDTLTIIINHTESLHSQPDWQDGIIRDIICNFKLWARCDITVQTSLFEFILKFCSSHGPRFSEIVPLQKLFDGLMMFYSGSNTSLISLEGCSESTISAFSVEQLGEIRAIFFQIVFTLLSTVPKAVDEGLHNMLSYLFHESNPRYKIEALNFFLRLINITEIGDRIINGMFGRKFVVLLIDLHSKPCAKIRMYALMCFCGIVQIASARGKLPVALTKSALSSLSSSNVLDEETSRETELLSPAPRRMSLLGSPSLAITSPSLTKANASLENSSAVGEDPSGKKKDIFDELGIPVSHLAANFHLLQKKLKDAMIQNPSSPKVTAAQCDIIYRILNHTMHGQNCKFLKDEIESRIPLEGSSVLFVDTEPTSPSSHVEERTSLASTRINIPLIFPSIISFISSSVTTPAQRFSFLADLRTGIQNFENFDAILSIPAWQACVFDMLSKEQSFMLTIEDNLFSKGWNGDMKNPKFSMASSAENTSKQLRQVYDLKRSKSIFDVAIHFLGEIHLHAIRFGMSPVGYSITRPGDIDAVQYHKLSTKDLLLMLKKGGRCVGVGVLSETISCLRCFAVNGELDVQNTGIDLLQHIIVAVKRECDTLENAINESYEARNIRKKFLDLNIWLIASVILEFVTLPPIQQTKRLQSRRRFSSPIAPRKELDNDDFRPRSLSFESSCPWIDSGKSDSELSRGISVEVNEATSAESSQDDTNNLDYVKKTWDLVESLLDLLGPMGVSTSWVSTELKDRIKLGMKVGIRLGRDVFTHVQDTVEEMLNDNNNANISNPHMLSLSDTPLGRAIDGVFWIILRVLLNIYTQGSDAPENSDVVYPSIQALRRLSILLESVREKSKEYYEIESLFIICRIVESLQYSHHSSSSSWVKEGVNFFSRLLIMQKSCLISKLIQLSNERKAEGVSNKVDTPDKEQLDELLTLLQSSLVLSTSNSSSNLLEDKDVISPTRSSIVGVSFSQKAPKVSKAPPVDPSTIVESLLSQINGRLATPQTNLKEVILQAVRTGLQISPDAEFSWKTWNKGTSVILDEAKKFEDSLMESRLTDMGMHKHSQAILKQLENYRSLEEQLINSLNKKVQDAVLKAQQVELKRNKDIVRNEDTQRRNCAKYWNKILEEVANERGAWGSGICESDEVSWNYFIWSCFFYFHVLFSVTKILWKTSSEEGPSRIKNLQVRNLHGSKHTSSSLLTQKLISSSDNVNTNVVNAIDLSAGKSDSSGSANLWKELLKYQTTRTIEPIDSTQPQVEDNEEDGIENNEDPADNDANIAHSGVDTASSSKEKIFFSVPCEIITPSTNTVCAPSSGLLQMTKSSITFTRYVDLSLQSSSKGGPLTVPFIYGRPGTRRNSLTVSNVSYVLNAHNTPTSYIWESLAACQPFASTDWNCSEISCALRRYYQLRNVAVELFFTNRTTVFINFIEKNIAARFIDVLSRRVRPPYLSLYLPAQLFPKLSVSSLSSLTQLWIGHEISNFEYLMCLNTIAGRTYNDLGQYPIFPWILADYKSKELDLCNPSTFRDFKWPMGAQNEEQRQLIAGKYFDLEYVYDESKKADDCSALPPFHFGSHYSVAGFVLWYLLRCEPFTSLHIQLQDGKFDKPDRMFSSMEAAWRGCTTNSSDVKELVPELFYFPEILQNINRLDLGTTQNGRKIDGVALPPWCKDSFEFISMHREALESEYVSQNLHHWIDLIFGFKQRPPHLQGGSSASVEACNVFFHLTYANAVDLEKLHKNDITLYNQYVCQISEFGQTPLQLFSRPHPCRSPINKLDIIWPIASVIRGVDTLSKEIEPPEHPRRIISFKPYRVSVQPLLFIAEIGDRLLTIDTSRVIGLHNWSVQPPDVVPPFRIRLDQAAYELSQG